MTYEIHCHHCGRYLGSADGDIDIRLKCPTCKSLLTYRMISLHTYDPTRGTLADSTKPTKSVHKQ